MAFEELKQRHATMWGAGPFEVIAPSLAEMHEAIKADCPAPYPSSIAAYREIVPTLFRQLKDPTYFVRRKLPPNARPEVTAARVAKVERAV